MIDNILTPEFLTVFNHAKDIAWWDGAIRFERINRNPISKVQNEEIFKFIKAFAPNKLGLHIGGHIDNGIRANYEIEEKPYTYTLNILKNCDICARAEQLPFKDSVFGYIVSFHTLEHIRGDVFSTLQEWLRVLVVNGLIGITMPDKRFFLHNPEVIKDGEAAYHEMTSDELYNIVEKLDVKILLFNTRKIISTSILFL